MVKFNVAVNGNNEVFTLNELDQLKSGNPIFNDLHCETCGCLLTFHHSSDRKAYLSTKSGQKHSEDCDKKFRVEQAKIRRSQNYAGTVSLTKSDQARLALAGYKVWKKKNKSINAAAKKNNISKHYNRKSKVTTRLKYLPVAGKNGTLTTTDNGQKRSLRTRTPIVAVSNISKYIGQAIKVVGKVDKVVVQKYGAYIIVWRQGQLLKVVLNEATFRESAQGFKSVLKELSSRVENGFNADTCAVVDVIVDNDNNPLCILRVEDALVINGKTVRMALKN